MFTIPVFEWTHSRILIVPYVLNLACCPLLWPVLDTIHAPATWLHIRFAKYSISYAFYTPVNLAEITHI